MKQIEELSANNSFEDLRQEIVERRKMQSDMLGWLYPSILESEIDKIYDMIDEKSRKGQLRSVIIDPISAFKCL